MVTFVRVLLGVAFLWLMVQGCVLAHGHGKHSHGHSHGFGHSHDGAVFSIDFYSYASKIRCWNPYFKSVFALLCLILCIVLKNIYVAVAIVIGMAYISIVLGGLDYHKYLSLMTIPLVFMIFGSIAIAFGVSKNPVGEYNLHLGFFYLYTTKQMICQMLRIFMVAFGAVSAMYMLTLSTPANEIIKVLRRAHVPQIMIELMNMIYRYIFLLMDTQCRMKNAAVSRLGYVDFKTSCLSFGRVASNLLVVSLKKANFYYMALEARCYTGELRFIEEDKPLKTKHIVLAALFVVVLLAIWLMTK